MIANGKLFQNSESIIILEILCKMCFVFFYSSFNLYSFKDDEFIFDVEMSVFISRWSYYSNCNLFMEN